MKIKIFSALIVSVVLGACASTKKETQTVVQPSQTQQLQQQLIQDLKTGVAIYFANNSTQIEQQYLDYLAASSKLLAQNKSFVLQIDGHTDSKGAPAANRKVSLERANAVRNILVMQYNVDPRQLTTNGFGSAQPISSNTTEEGRAHNRRVTLTLKIN